MGGQELLDTAVSAARKAAAVHRSHAGGVDVEDWDEKGTSDFVSHVDRAAEQTILDTIRQRFPDHAFLAEEQTSERHGVNGVTVEGDSDTVWIIDPLDGTTNFLHGYPMYGVSIAAVHAGIPLAAVVVNSVSGEEWTAVAGAGARRNGVLIRVSGIENMSRSLIGTGFPFKAQALLPRYAVQFDAVIRRSAGVRRAGSAALDLCHVATGWFDGFWELTLAPWDIAAGTLIVQEAGGVVTRLDGSPVDVSAHGALLAGNPHVHGALGDILRHADADARATWDMED